MAYAPSQKLVDYAIIAALIGGAYVIYSKFFATAPPKTCPAGQHYVDVCADAGTGLGQWLCNAGRNLLGGSGLDCKADEVVCAPGYTLQNGQCTAILPGGCTITDADCKKADPRTYLNLNTCECTSSNFTDECTLGSNDCAYVPGVGKRVLECIFVPTFGNRWQVLQPETPCGGDTETEICVESCRWAPTQHAKENCEAECRGLPWPWPVTPQTNIVDCGNGCGMVDLNNPPGTTCESVCRDIWTPGCVQDIPECLRLNTHTPGGMFAGFMSKSQCEGAGYIFVNKPPGYCANQARLDYDKLRAAACCW